MEMITEWLFQTYQFFASIKVPGFDISFIQLYLGISGVTLSIFFAKTFLGLGNGGLGQRGGNNKNIKISKERKGDTK